MRPTRLDIIIALCILLCAGSLWLTLTWIMPYADVAVVTVEGEVVARLDLSMDTAIQLDTGHTVAVSDGRVLVVDAPCPDHICVHHPPISRAGESIICLPYRLIVTVEEDVPNA